jgi:hypothetical protein
MPIEYRDREKIKGLSDIEVIDTLLHTDERIRILKRIHTMSHCKFIAYLIIAFERKKLGEVKYSDIRMDLDLSIGTISRIARDWEELGKIRIIRKRKPSIILPVYENGKNVLMEYWEKISQNIVNESGY